jgi:hypothetical protein
VFLQARPLAYALLTGVVSVSAALAGTSPRPLTVTSTLDRKTVLPHRIHWLAAPSVPSAQVSRVDFLIDGKIRWTEHSAPYAYGNDGNWLVTSWLTPGMHRFTAKATAANGRTASDTVRARVLPTPAPPHELSGTRWARTFTAGQLGPGTPVGTWEVTIDGTGWKIKDPLAGGNYIDVAYLSPDMLESRGGIWTRNPTAAEKAGKTAQIQEGNGWCPDTNTPVDYRWAVTGTTLNLTLVGTDHCGDPGNNESSVWAGAWTRVA